MTISLLLVGLSQAACKSEATPSPSPGASVSAASVTSAAAAPTASVEVPPSPPRPPTLHARAVEIEGLTSVGGVFAVGDALVVISEHRAGRIVHKSGGGSEREPSPRYDVEWLGGVPEEYPTFGRFRLDHVSGRRLEELDAIYRNENGRIPMPSYAALTGKGHDFTFAPGGGFGVLAGIARVGGSTLIAGNSWEGPQIVTVRGPRHQLYQIPTKLHGCEVDPKSTFDPEGKRAAVSPWAFASAGQVVALAGRCCHDKPAVEIWAGPPDKPTIEELDAHWKGGPYSPDLVAAGAHLYVISSAEGDPVLAVREGKLVALPLLEASIGGAFTSARGELMVESGGGFFRFGGGAWSPVGRLAWPTSFSTYVEHDGQLWATRGSGLYRLEPGEPIEYEAGCASPFVHLFDVSIKSPPGYGFPTTKKALGSFDGKDRIQLVEHVESDRRIGVVVPDQATGEAVIAHIAKTMPDETPRLVCHRPREPRVLPLEP